MKRRIPLPMAAVGGFAALGLALGHRRAGRCTDASPPAVNSKGAAPPESHEIDPSSPSPYGHSGCTGE